ARGEQTALEQRAADAMRLPWLLDRERGFGLLGKALPERAQLCDAAQNAIDEEAVNHRVHTERELDVVGDERARHRAAKTIAAAPRIEAEQVIAVRAGTVDPQLADHAVGQELLHRVSIVRSKTSGLPRIVQDILEANRAPCMANIAMQQAFD